MVLAIAYLYLFLSLDSNKALYVKLGTYLIAKHQAPFQHDYSEALESLNLGNAEPAIRTLEDWQEVKKGDRVFPLKRTLLLKLADFLHKENNIAQLLTWTREWQSLDNRDISARAFYFEALRLTPEFHAEGVEGIASAYQQFPANPRLSRFYADTLRAAGDTATADKIHKSKIANQLLGWELFWDTGQGFNGIEKSAVDVKAADDGARFTIEFTLPANTLRFRLDLPPQSEIGISDLDIRIDDQALPFVTANLELVMMHFNNGLLISNGERDPYIIFNIKYPPASLDQPRNLSIRFSLSNTNRPTR